MEHNGEIDSRTNRTVGWFSHLSIHLLITFLEEADMDGAIPAPFRREAGSTLDES